MLKNSLLKQPSEEDPDEGIKDLVEITLKKMVSTTLTTQSYSTSLALMQACWWNMHCISTFIGGRGRGSLPEGNLNFFLSLYAPMTYGSPQIHLVDRFEERKGGQGQVDQKLPSVCLLLRCFPLWPTPPLPALFSFPWNALNSPLPNVTVPVEPLAI